MELTAAQIGAICTVAVALITALLKTIKDHFDETRERMIAMEERHRKQGEDMLSLTGQVGRLEGEREGFMLGVEKISAKVLNELRELKK